MQWLMALVESPKDLQLHFNPATQSIERDRKDANRSSNQRTYAGIRPNKPGQLKFDLYDKIKEAQRKDNHISRNIEKEQWGETQDLTIVGELVKRGSRICIPPDQELKEQIMTEAHCTPYTAHPGATKMYQDLWSNFWWDGMKNDIANFVQRCLICQQVKAEHKKPPGLLMPLQIPERKWSHITIDFVT